MPRPAVGDDDWDEPWPSSDADDEPTVPCPYCRREIHEESQRCPHCGQYISQEDAPPGPKPWWLIVGVLLCLFVVYLWIVGW